MYGYGEDGLTYHALSSRLTDVLTQLGDSSPPDETVVFYRPSFGRKAGSRLGTPVSQFGEFDGIVGTPKGVYLMEAKWSRSLEVWGKPSFELSSVQLRRHAIFRWLLERWKHVRPQGWDEFRSEARLAFEQKFPGFTIASEGAGVAQNLAFVLKQLEPCGAEVHDVVLYTTIDKDHPMLPPFAQPSSFRTVQLRFDGADPSGFYILGAPGTRPDAETDHR
jgi:hypothetical protein